MSRGRQNLSTWVGGVRAYRRRRFWLRVIFLLYVVSLLPLVLFSQVAGEYVPFVALALVLAALLGLVFVQLNIAFSRCPRCAMSFAKGGVPGFRGGRLPLLNEIDRCPACKLNLTVR